MTTVLLVVAIVISGAIGYLVVSLIMCKTQGGLGFFWLKTTLGIGVGYGVTSLLSFIWQSGVGNFDVLYPALELALAILLYLGLRKTSKWRVDSPTPLVSPRRGQQSYLTVLLQSSLGGGILLGITAFVFGTISAPNGMWDAWMVQNRAARFFYLGGGYWTNAFSPLLVSADYPPLVGMSVARLWRYVGHETIFGPVFFAFTITSALIGLFIVSMAYFRGRVFAYVAGLVLLTSSALFVFAPAQLADIPLAFHFLATIVLLRIYEGDPLSHKPFLLLSGMTSALALWTKNEGWLFVAAIIVSHFIVPALLRQKPFRIGPVVQFVLGSLPVLLVVLYFKLVFAPAYDLLRHQPADSSLSGYLLNPSRYLIVAQSYLTQLYDLTSDRSTPLIALLLVTLFFGIDRRNWKNTGSISGFSVLLIMVVGEFFIYLLTPNDLRWQVSSSIHRLFLQLWPIFVFETMMLLNMPDIMRDG